MYPAPEVLEATVFAAYPDALRTATASNDWIRGQPAGLAGGSFLEGPAFDRDGNLWCVDIPNGRILRISPEGRFDVAVEYDGWPNGLKFHKDGRLFIADYKHGIMAFQPGERRVKPVVTRLGIEPFKGVNDLFFSNGGDLYFTDQGMTGHQDPSGSVYRLTAGGHLSRVMAGIPSPNGIVMNANETALLVAVTRANAVWRLPLLASGETAKVGTFLQLSGGTGPDGLALDAAGGLAVAHAGKGVVWIFDDTGEPIFRIQVPEGRHPTNLAYGGTEERTLFITESDTGTILQVRLPTPGKPTFSHRGST